MKEFTNYYFKNEKLYLNQSQKISALILRIIFGGLFIVFPSLLILAMVINGNTEALFLLPVPIFVVVLIFSTNEACVDAQKRTISIYWKWLFLNRKRTEIQIPESSQLRIRQEKMSFSGRTDESRTMISIIPKGEYEANVETFVHQKFNDKKREPPTTVRRISEVLSKYLDMELVDCCQGDSPVVRLPSRLDESVEEQWERRLANGETLPTLPDLDIVSVVKNQFDSMSVEYPLVDWKYGSQRIALLIAGGMLMTGELSLVWAMDADGVELLPLMALGEGLFLISAGFWLLRGCLFQDRITLSNSTLTMRKHLTTVSFPLSELEAFFVGPSSKSTSRLISDEVSGGIVAVSDTQYFQVGTHIPVEEIEYLHTVLLRRMIGVNDSE